MFKKLFKEGYENELRVFVLEQYSEKYMDTLEKENLSVNELFELATMKIQDNEEYIQIVLRGDEMKTCIEKFAYFGGVLIGDIHNKCIRIKRYLAG